MADMKIVIGAEIKELEQKLAVAKSKLAGIAGTANDVSSKLQTVGSRLSSIAKNLISGGIAAGIAVIAGALIVMVKSFFEASEASKKLKLENEKITKTFLDAADAAGEEMGKVSLLKTVLDSENATRLQKATALKELKKINYDYFGQLDIEDGKVKGLTNAYDGYIQRIIRSINAKANVDLLTDAYKEQAKALAQINQNIKAGEEKFTTSNLTEFQIQDAIRRFGLTFGAKKGESVIIDLNEEQLIADLLNAEAKIQSITSTIKDNIIDAFNPKEIKVKEVKIKPEKVTVDLLPQQSFSQGKDKLIPERIISKNPLSLVLPEIKFIGDPEQAKRTLDNLFSYLEGETLKARAEEFADNVAMVIQTTMEGTAFGIGDAIGRALGGEKNVIPNLFGGLMESVGTQVQDLGKFLIKSAITVKIAKEAFQKLLANPIAAIAVGIGLVALGALLKAQAAKQYQGFASGTTGVQEGGVYNVGERGPERIFLPRGAQVQPANEVQAFSGGGVVLQPSIHYDGTGFRIMLNRVDAQMSRNG